MGDANISLHSFRSGGATKAANALVSDQCWKRHGRLKSDTAKDGYVEDSLDNRRQVSKALGVGVSEMLLLLLLYLSLVGCSSQQPYWTCQQCY